MTNLQGYGSTEIYYDDAHLTPGDMPFPGQIHLKNCVFRKVVASIPENAKNIELYAMHNGHKEIGEIEKDEWIGFWESVTDDSGDSKIVYTSSLTKRSEVPHARLFVWLDGERIRPKIGSHDFEKDDKFDNYHLQMKIPSPKNIAGKIVEFKAMIWNYHAKMDKFELHITADLP